MREMGVRGVLIYCAEYRCGHHVILSADIRPDFNGGQPAAGAMGYRNTK